jgi:CRISPR-associated endonuclease/helicase Cas3
MKVVVDVPMTFYAHSRPGSSQEKWQVLREHLFGVAAITARLAAKIGMPHAGELIGLTHDLGKYSEAFQQYLVKVANDAAMEMEPDLSLKGSVDHSTAGTQIIAAGLASTDQGLAAQMLALCVASHHSGLIDCLLPDGADGLARRLSKDDALSHCDEVSSRIEVTIRARLETLLSDPDVTTEIDAAMGRICERDSDEIIRPFKQGLLLRMLFSCLIDGDRIDTADFDKPGAASLRQHGEYVSWQQLIDRLEHKLAALSNERWVDQLRCEISEHCLAASGRPRGVFTLTVPNGWRQNFSEPTLRVAPCAPLGLGSRHLCQPVHFHRGPER